MKFQLVFIGPSGKSYAHSLTLAEAHARLGRLAGERNLNMHIHPGDWGEGTYSTAYKGYNPMLYVQACVSVQEF